MEGNEVKDNPEPQSAGTVSIKGADQTHIQSITVHVNKEVLSSAIEEGIGKGIEDILAHFKSQTKLLTFALLGILAMLAMIALVLAGFHNLPLQ